MPGPVFIPNPRFVDSDDALRAIEPIGAAVIEAASQAAPFRLGYISGSIEAAWVETAGGRRALRITVNDFKGQWYEFGTAKLARRPYLGPAALEVVGNLQ